MEQRWKKMVATVKKKKKRSLLATVVQFQTVEKNRDLIILYVYYIGFKVT